MSSTEVLIDLIVFAIIKMVITLIPYIICKFARKNIDNKFAKKFTILFSILSILIYALVSFIATDKVNIGPIIVWNVVGYLIIAPGRKKNTTPADFSNEPFFKIEKPTSVTKKLDSDNDTEMVKQPIENQTVEEKTTVSQNKRKKSKRKSNVIAITTILVLSIALISVSAFAIFQQAEIKSVKSQLDNLSIDYQTAQDTIADLRKSNAENTVENLNNRLIASFYTEHAGCIGEDNYYYHSDPYCDYFDSSSFHIYNTEAAKAKGYRPCPYCCN